MSYINQKLIEFNQYLKGKKVAIIGIITSLTAIAKPGYRFVGWSGTYELSENSIEVAILEDGITLTAIFERE